MRSHNVEVECSSLSEPKRFSVIRDAVHGDVYLSYEELAILDTREMQRLRGVKQLGTAFLVFPGANHTRFEHSIGTVYVTEQLIKAINFNFDLDPRNNIGLGEAEARVIRAAALIHDVTHIPYGHNFEDQTGLLARHDSPERFQSMLSSETELGRLLAKQGLLEDVLRILAPKPDDQGTPPFWSQILSDTICSDLCDYLARDAYYTGLNLSVDPRLVNYFKVDRTTGNLYIDLAKRNLLREDILSEIVRTLEARYYFSERVYYHHAKVAAGTLVAHAVEIEMAAGVITDRDLFTQTDASLIELLDSRATKLPAQDAQRVRSLVERFRNRRLPKRACVYPRYAGEAAQKRLVERFFASGKFEQRTKAEQHMSELVRFSSGIDVDVLVTCPAARMQLKEVETHVRWPGETSVRPLSDFADRVPRLADLSRAYRELWKFYVFADTDDDQVLRKLQEIAVEEFPGALNQYSV
ncbi:MAG: HD superfamily phosphohydrolase [Planctomycetota bacterium]|jgi:HD superfamily phosphohydrolase